MTRLWIVRAGKDGQREVASINSNRLLPGFIEVGDLSKLNDRAAILASLPEVMPDANPNRLKNFAAQLNQFAHSISVGDLVVLPRKLTASVAVGEITGPYVFDANDPYRHSRAVKWLIESASREVFKQDLLHSFGALMTICEVSRNNALARVRSVVKGGADPGHLIGTPGTMHSAVEDDTGDADDAEIDIEFISNQQIVALIKTEFAGHALATLVAEILSAEGYITRVSPPGPDGGVDILAAGGTLGLGEGRVCVQVKSGEGAASHDVVLKLIGSVSNVQAQTGLLVCLGGVNKAAQKALDDNFFKLRVWQMPDLLRALYRTYNELSDTTRAKLPLKQIWVPLASGGE